MAAGRTRPLLLECSRASSAKPERMRFVVKALGLPEVHPFTLAHEFLGSRLARLHGLAAPPARLVAISEAFVSVTAPDLKASGLHIKPGLAVGTEFIPDLMTLPVPVHLGPDEIHQAAAIYVFDLMVHNPDRSTASPNCGRAGQRLVPYDFETAFSFRFAISGSMPWKVAGLPFSTRHLFHAALGRADVEWPRLFARFRSMPPGDLTEACSTIPEAWAEIGREIHAHLTSVREHWLEFEREVATSLGGSR